MSLDAPPLTPDPDTARRWLGGELARPAYANRQTWWETLQDWLNRHTPGAGSVPGGTPVAAVVVLLVLAAAGVILVRSVRRWRAGPSSGSGSTESAVFGETVLSAADHRRRAEAALGAGDTVAAVQEAFRALTRGLQERTVIADRDGLTATEVAGHAGEVLPRFAGPLHEAAAHFNAVTYGGVVPTTEQATALLDLDTQVAGARTGDLPVAAR